jgi:hypothetical protein
MELLAAPAAGRRKVAASLKVDRQKMFKIIFWRYYRHLAEHEAMPYSPKQKRDTREKILESVRRLFNRKGYSGRQLAAESTFEGIR